MPPVYALVDCNNFYASCERLFRPDLKGKPILVLSNNDGCVIARSAETKALGIKMGVPVFQIKDTILHEGIEVFSSNFALYGDISARVMALLEHIAPSVEVYSIDEAFLNLSGVSQCMGLSDLGNHIKTKVYRDTGIQVCVGIAPTKTLAKLANHAAKQFPKANGTVDLTNPAWVQRLLSITPVSEVWGVGRKISVKLEEMNIKTAQDLACAPTSMIRKRFSVVLERTVRELNGISCIKFEQAPPPKKQIVCSRTFGQRVTEFDDLHAAICKHAERASEKLRIENLTAKNISVFVRTNPHNSSDPYYANSGSYTFSLPTSDTRDLITAAVAVLEALWKPGYRYMKAGVMLSDFYEPGTYQPSLFDNTTGAPRTNSSELMRTMDQINNSGLGNIVFAGQLRTQRWKMNRNNLSPRYTTSWNDLPIARA